ncbi:MAG: hypothetical protein JWO13_220 [Acidobacteriales bacterium]|nr:hypothetical protein [Terriglobales bacterium]
MRLHLIAVFLLATLTASAQKNCVVKPNPEYDKKIAEFTTEKFFSTELVDHLPQSSCVPSPENFLKHIVGAPGVLTHVADINAYMRLLASKSPRVKVFDIGKSEEGREMLLVAISEEANIAKLDRYKEINARLADPRGLSEADAQKLIAEGKPMYWASGSIHSPETASPELLMELAYRLAVEDSPFIQKIRKDEIVLLTPVAEVDGRDRMVDVYTYNHNHPDEQSKPLVWWGHYVAHDNNRDGMQLSLALSRNMMSTFLKFHPQVFHDLHESVPYLYISTGTGPYNAWLDPIVISEWQSMAYHEINEMTKRGTIGVWTHGFYDGWAPNYMFYLANGHNSIGRFYETFGNGGADTKIRTLPPASTNRDWFRPNPPLPKVKWSIRNNINMAQSALLFGMNNVANNGRDFLANFYAKSQRSVAKARTEGPAAYVFTADDPRPAEQARLLNLLKAQGIEVHKTTAEIRMPAPVPAPRPDRSGDSTSSDSATPDAAPQRMRQEKPAPKELVYPAGSYVVRMDQPYSRMADMMLDTQFYSSRDPRSYDDTGWTLGALRNVRTARVMDTKILDAKMDKISGDIALAPALTGTGNTILITNTGENTMATLRFRAPTAKIEVAEEPFDAAGNKFSAGTWILRDAASDVTDQVRSLGLRSQSVAPDFKVKTHPLAAPRIAMMHTWQGTQNDGWYRIALDKLGVPYTYIPDTVVREMQPNELREKFDVIIMPPYGRDLSGIITGIPKRDGGKPLAWKNTPETPNLVAPGVNAADDIRGGLGYAGIANIQKFVSDGGLLIATAASARIPVQAGMTEMLSITDPRLLQAPGSVVQTTVEDKRSPITYGLEDKLYVYFNSGPIFRISTGLGENQGAAFAGGPAEGRPSGRGTASDPDVVQGRAYTEPEKPVKRTPAEQEAYIQEDNLEFAKANLPAKEKFPRVILRFAPEKDLLLSGMIVSGNEIAEKPAVVDVTLGKGHIVLFSINPMWRDETMGSFPLMFNAMMNFDHLDAGR